MRSSLTLHSYQSEIIDIFEAERARGDSRIHIVAPPGSGKTIVGLEIMLRLDAPTLILVPSLTLVDQWREKIGRFFLESGESLDELVSTHPSEIRRVNILTYQSLSGSESTDAIREKIFDLWYRSEGEDESRDAFDAWVGELREDDPRQYQKSLSKYQKKLKQSGEDTSDLMKQSVFEYVDRLRAAGVTTMIVDEAHHLTTWWSHVLYEISTRLDHPYIVGLTATPPFDDADYMELDQSYVDLLGVVDYYVPTPAIVRSGRLAPYCDLIYTVTPDDTLQGILREKESRLYEFLQIHRVEIVTHLHQWLIEHYDRLKIKSGPLLDRYARYIYHSHGDIEIDMSLYLTATAGDPLTLEDIAKSVAKWGYQKNTNDQGRITDKDILAHPLPSSPHPNPLPEGEGTRQGSEKISEKFGLPSPSRRGVGGEVRFGAGGGDGLSGDQASIISSLFWDLGYIRRGQSLYRFETPLEKSLIYSHTKLDGVKAILTQETSNLGESLRAAIITDFLDPASDWLTAHDIFDRVSRDHPQLSPFLVSGQGIWGMRDGEKTLLTDETILSVTQKLSRGESRVIIGTRGVLGEGWDCPALNTLIDLTGVSAYMTANQVHGRAIRTDPDTPEKVANIYDIVCVGEGHQGLRDLDRLCRKHAQFYGVDESGGIVKGVDHIMPQLSTHIRQIERNNAATLRKSNLRPLIRDLWGVGTEYQNAEIFSLSIEITRPYEIVPRPARLSLWSLLTLHPERWREENLLELGRSSYHRLVRQWISELLDASIRVMREHDDLPSDFSYDMRWTDTGSITIMSDHSDPLVSKRWIETVAPIFAPITDQRYCYRVEKKVISSNKVTNHLKSLETQYVFQFVRSVIIAIFFIFLTVAFVSFLTFAFVNLFTFTFALLISIISGYFWLRSRFMQRYDTRYPLSDIPPIGLPKILVSNETKRARFLGITKRIPLLQGWYPFILTTIIAYSIMVVEIIETHNYDFGNIASIMIGIAPYSLPVGLLFITLIRGGIKIWYIFLDSRLLILPCSITPVSQSDVGQPHFLSAQITKLWI